MRLRQPPFVPWLWLRLTIAALVLALGMVLAAGLAWWLKPARVFTPLSIPSPLALANGDAQTPPHIASGQLLSFTSTTWCNSAGHALPAHAALSFVAVGTATQTAVPVLTGLPLTVAAGCTANHPLQLRPPTPLPPGTWELVLTVSVTQEGEAQTLSKVSAPFVVTP